MWHWWHGSGEVAVFGFWWCGVIVCLMEVCLVVFVSAMRCS